MTDVSVTRRRLLAGLSSTVITASMFARATVRAAPVVRIRDGRLCGFTRNGLQIFLGIPYGASTGGERRFLPPALPDSWRGVRVATRLGQRAPQTTEPVYATAGAGPYMAGGRQDELLRLQEPMGEDCLVLNVLTPRADHAARPVIVYLHGGGFSSGSGATMTMSDRFVAENDIVVVTVNHRLGALGYAYLGGLSPRYEIGNPGLLDLVAALKWVRDNIHAFGGDSGKVTIFGESGGGAKVALMMAMPQAAGLFRAAIIESGGISKLQSTEVATEAVKSFVARSEPAATNVEALQTMSSHDLQTIATSSPILDGHTLAAQPWLEAAPDTAASIPLLISYSAEEETGFLSQHDPSLLHLDWSQLPAKLAAAFHKSEAELAPAIEAYRSVYTNGDATEIFFRMQTIQRFGRLALLLANLKVMQDAPVFFYRFQYDPGLFGLRTFHTSDLPLTMRMVLQPAAEPLSKRLAGAFANFARHGDPNGPGLPAWPRYERTQQPIMLFDRDAIPAGPDPERAARSVLISIIGEHPGF